MTRIKKNPILMIILFIVCWNIIFLPILCISAKSRAYRILNPYIQETKSSIIINNELGEVKKIKINSIFNYSKKKKNHVCIEMKVITKKGIYNICTISENKFQGYVYNGEIHKEITSESLFEVEDSNENFKKELNSYLNKEVDYPNSREPIIYNIENNKYKLINICKYKKEENCKETNDTYLNNLIDSFKDKYQISTID